MASPQTTPHPHWRAVEFFHAMIANPAAASPTYTTLDADQKLIFALGVRNLYLATSRAGAAVRDRDKEILQAMQLIVDDDARPAVLGGVGLSFYPSGTYSELRHVEDLDRVLRQQGHCHANHFAQVSVAPRMFAAFVRS